MAQKPEKTKEESDAYEKEAEQVANEVNKVMSKKRPLSPNGYQLQPFIVNTQVGIFPRVTIVRKQDEGNLAKEIEG